MTLQAWHTCMWGGSPFLLCRSSQALSDWMGSVAAQQFFKSLQRCSIGFKSRLWLGHSRTLRDVSRSHSCIVLAVCLGLLSCFKVNLSPQRNSGVPRDQDPSPPIAHFGRVASSRKSPGGTKRLLLKNDGGHCVLGDLQCCRHFFWYPSPDLCLDTILSRSSTDYSFDLLS